MGRVRSSGAGRRTASCITPSDGAPLSWSMLDRLGGPAGFLLALAGVAAFGALGAIAPGLGVLALFYSLNRFFGSGAWNAMVKVIASWFPPKRLATALAALSLSYVFGSI